MPRNKVAQRRITTLLNKPEEEIISKAENKGYNISEIIRMLIRNWGKEEFPETPAYAKALAVRAKKMEKQIKDEENFDSMSNEEYGEKVLGGQVRGNKVAFRVGGGREIYYPLSTIKEKTIKDGVIPIHQTLLDGTFMYGTREPDEYEWTEIWDGWSDRQPNWHQRRAEGLPDITQKTQKTEDGDVSVESNPEVVPLAPLDGEDLVDISTEE